MLSLLVPACGGDGGGFEEGDPEGSLPTPGNLEERYRTQEPAFWNRFLLYAFAPSDKALGRDHVFEAGAAACLLAESERPPTSALIGAIDLEYGLTPGGAEAVAGAATQVLCPGLGYTVVTRWQREAHQIAQLVGNAVGASPDVEAVGRNATLICDFLATNSTAEGLTSYLHSEGHPFLPGGASEQAIKLLVRHAVGIRCPEQDDKLGPYWYE